jgi:hypothetical protein
MQGTGLSRPSGTGRLPVATKDRFIDARRDDIGLVVRQLRSGTSGRYGSKAAGQALGVDRLQPVSSGCSRSDGQSQRMAGSVSAWRHEEADFRRDDAADGGRFSGAPAGTRYRTQAVLGERQLTGSATAGPTTICYGLVCDVCAPESSMLYAAIICRKAAVGRASSAGRALRD